jgi:starvation-inducible DNA-binding protein
MKPSIGLSEESMHASVKLLSLLLSDEVMLYTKTRNYHWNVSGESFMELHKLFQSQYTELEETIDSVAERVGKMGGKSIGTMKEFLEQTRLKEYPGQYGTQNDMMLDLLNDHETLAVEIRKDGETSAKNKDAGTADFFTGILEQHETTAWVLRRYLN